MIKDLVVVLIVGSAALGLISALRSLVLISRERSFLKEWKEKLLSPDVRDASTSLREWHDANSGSANAAKKRRAYHLSKRVDTMLQALENDPTKAKELPELHDLHELTLQDELGRASSATLRTVISFLLILGILGTLTGVHSVVSYNSGTALMNAMAAALLPSMLAVGSTVVLMFLRGWYSAWVDSFLEELDFYTMTVLSPRLQPASDTQRNKEKLKIAIERFSENAGKMKTASRELWKQTDELSKGIQDFSNAIEQMQSLVRDAEEIESSLSRDSLPKELTDWTSRMQDLEKRMEKLEKDNGDMDSHVAALKEKGENAEKGYDPLEHAIQSAEARLRESMDMVNQLAASSGDLVNAADMMKRYEEHLAKLTEQTQSVADIYTAVLSDVSQVQSHREQADKVANEAYQSALTLVAASESMHELVTKQYTLDADKRAVADLLESVQAGVSDLDRSQKHLADSFRERARKIGITK